MSTEVTAESLRAHATWLDDNKVCQTPEVLRNWAKYLERLWRPLPTEPGWYPGIVVERGGESCTGALLTSTDMWVTSQKLDGCVTHFVVDRHATIRWAEQDGKTPGQTAFEAVVGPRSWGSIPQRSRDAYEREAAAVLAAHGTPTLNPVGESPEPGARGLLPVVQGPAGWYCHATAVPFRVGDTGSVVSHTVLADPRPDGAA